MKATRHALKMLLIVLATFFGLLLSFFIIRQWILPRKSTITLENVGPTTVSEVLVYVAGEPHPIGSIEPASKVSIDVMPAGEGSITIQFRDKEGRLTKLDAGGYLAPNIPVTQSIAFNLAEIVSRTIEYK